MSYGTLQATGSHGHKWNNSGDLGDFDSKKRLATNKNKLNASSVVKAKHWRVVWFKVI